MNLPVENDPFNILFTFCLSFKLWQQHILKALKICLGTKLNLYLFY